MSGSILQLRFLLTPVSQGLWTKLWHFDVYENATALSSAGTDQQAKIFRGPWETFRWVGWIAGSFHGRFVWLFLTCILNLNSKGCLRFQTLTATTLNWWWVFMTCGMGPLQKVQLFYQPASNWLKWDGSWPRGRDHSDLHCHFQVGQVAALIGSLQGRGVQNPGSLMITGDYIRQYLGQYHNPLCMGRQVCELEYRY